jgi:hypothetical protein
VGVRAGRREGGRTGGRAGSWLASWLLCFPVLPHIGRATTCGALHAHSWRQRWREGAHILRPPFLPSATCPVQVVVIRPQAHAACKDAGGGSHSHSASAGMPGCLPVWGLGGCLPHCETVLLHVQPVTALLTDGYACAWALSAPGGAACKAPGNPHDQLNRHPQWGSAALAAVPLRQCRQAESCGRHSGRRLHPPAPWLWLHSQAQPPLCGCHALSGPAG